MRQALPRFSRRQLLQAGAALGASACLPAPAAETKGQKIQLSVATFPLMDQIVKDCLKTWGPQHPEIEVEIVNRQYDDHHTAMTTALSTSGHLPDIIALESSYMGRFAFGNGLDDLSAPAFGAEAYRSLFVPFAFEQARNREHRIIAMPADIGPGTLFYRTDLLAKAGLKEEDLTRSWDDYVEAGARIKAATGAYLIGHTRLVKDIVSRAGAKAGDGLFFDASGQPAITSHRFQRAFEVAKRVRELKLDAQVDTWFNDWAESLKRGRLATEMSGAWMAGQMANWVAPKTAGLWRAAMPPERTCVAYGGTYYAIPRRSDPAKKQAAWTLIKELCLSRSRQLQAFKTQDSFPSLLSAQDDPFFDEPLPFLAGQPARQLWRDIARSIPITQMHKQNKFADEVVNGELDNVLEYGKPIPEALADAQALLVHRANR